MRRSRYIDGGLDRVDGQILTRLAGNARMPMKELAKAVGLSAPSAAERVRRLEENGVIAGYTIAINPGAVGLTLAFYVRVRPLPGELERVSALISSLPEVIECDRVSGDDCFVAKVLVRSVADIETLIDKLLPYSATNTSLIQSSPVPRRMPAL